MKNECGADPISGDDKSSLAHLIDDSLTGISVNDRIDGGAGNDSCACNGGQWRVAA